MLKAAFVVLELFTSQGCSSCPPADAILPELAAQPNVIALAFHVDYWDGLGWKDAFSSEKWTDRQHDYADVLGGGVYTPELVVNGRAHVIGSDRSRARAAIDAAARQPQIDVTMTAKREAAAVHVTYATASAPTDRVLVFLTESGLTTRVERGENRGRILRNDFVVRAGVEGRGGEARLPLPGDGHYQVVVLIQGKDRAIRGAARAEI